MPFPRQIPMVKMAIAFIIGIAIEPLTSVPVVALRFFVVLGFLNLIVLQFYRSVGRIHYFRSICVYAMFLLVGFTIHAHKNESSSKMKDQFDQGKFFSMGLTCTSIPKMGARTRFEGEVTHIAEHFDSMTSVKPFKILVNVFDFDQNLRVGQKIIIKAKLQPIPSTVNPEAFDYGQYLQWNEILFQTFISNSDVLAISESISPYFLLDGWLRDRAIRVFEQNLSGDHLAVALALVLGYRDRIENNLYDAFADTGSMHILAVSGLHVGILSYFIGLILQFIQSNSLPWKVLKITILVGAIAVFAFITGSSPSVIRASIMFSLFQISKISHGNYSVYNSIGATALIMLFINPYNLYQVGFQLSFAAILSIVIFFPIINSWIKVNGKISQKIWQMLSIAFSVQILTFPIALLYFHQFPVYFFVTGISAVLLATVLLGGGLLLLLLSTLPLPLAGLFDIYDMLLWTLVTSTKSIQTWPFAMIKNIHFDQMMILLSLISVLFLALFSVCAHKRYLFYGLGFICLALLYNSYDKIENFRKQEIVVYESRYPLIDIISGNEIWSYADRRLKNNNIQYAAENYRISRRIKNLHVLGDIRDFEEFISRNAEELKNFEVKAYLRGSKAKGDFNQIMKRINALQNN